MILEFLKHVSEINERKLTVYTHVHFCCALTYKHTVIHTDILNYQRKKKIFSTIFMIAFPTIFLEIPSLKLQIYTKQPILNKRFT